MASRDPLIHLPDQGLCSILKFNGYRDYYLCKLESEELDTIYF